MQIEIFKLEYLKFILSDFRTFLGFIIILTILTGDLRNLFYKAKAFFIKVNSVYRDMVGKSKQANK